MSAIAPRVRRIGDQSLVNAYLVEEGGAVTIIDAGAPGLWSHVLPELAAMGCGLADVRAIVLTHGHSDHVGFAERARRERGWPVWVHGVDAALARGEVPNPAAGGGPMRAGPMLRFGWWAVRHGLFRVPHLGEVATFGDGATLDVPGAPRVIHVPGHTPGSAALHFAGHDALFVGDAMCTYAVSTGRTGPQVAPFSADAELALASLARLEGVDASLVLPGHGEAFRGGADEAVRLAREAPLRGKG
jgi:glyoxylase-like metal-dependent hydrolase (beta-lactamase superfamily II)